MITSINDRILKALTLELPILLFKNKKTFNFKYFKYQIFL